MAKFKEVPQKYLFNKLLGYWFNTVRNYNEDIRDNDFFAVVNNCFDHDTAIELITLAYSDSEIEAMREVRSRRCRLDLSDSLDIIFTVLWNHESTRDKCRAVLEAIRDCMTNDADDRGDDEIAAKRFAEMQRLLKLSDIESDLLILSYIKSQTCFEWPRRVSDRDKPLYYAMAIDRSLAEVANVMTTKGKLRKFELLDFNWDFNYQTIGCFIDGTGADALERRFYRKSEDNDILPWSFYGDLSLKDGETVKQIIAASKGKCNILLYGAPGTGKTSFAKSLVKELGRNAFEIMQGDENGKNMRSEARMVGIQICNDHEDSTSDIMLVDEADELLRSSSCGLGFPEIEFGNLGRTTEKGIMNAILDDMKMPAIWISNAPAWAMDESVRRRFDYSIRFDRMNTAQRVNIWKNLIKKHDLTDVIQEDMIGHLAAEYETSAGGISIVLENVKKFAPDRENVRELIAMLMKPHCKLMGIEKRNDFLPAKGYSLEGLNIKGSIGLDKVLKAAQHFLDTDFGARDEDRPRMNILLFGPPGTGKTEFVKYLGSKLDRKVLVMSGSDILNKYVGGTEANIANAFHRAEAEHAILFFDEIDGLVQNREDAQRSWEVTQVNELLQQMEEFDGVMIAATNFCKNLDPAIMRRFTFKLELDYLDDNGKKIFFEQFFKTKLSDGEFAELRMLRNLAPGDFRTVRQNRFYLGDEQSNMDLITALKDECSLKKDGGKTPCIGF